MCRGSCLRTLVLSALGAVLLGGCSAVSPRPMNSLRTLAFISLGHPGDTPDRIEQNLDHYTASRPIPGNQVTLLENGNEAYPQMLAAIDQAQQRICLTVYDFRSDKTGRVFVDALARAAARGVVIRLNYDDYGSEALDPSVFAPLRAFPKKQAQIRAFNSHRGWTLLRFNNRCHRKILTIDGKIAFMGGLNVGDHYDGDGVTGWRDHALRVEGPAAAETEATFAQVWNQSGWGWPGRNLPLVGSNPLKRVLDWPLSKVCMPDFTPPVPNHVRKNCGTENTVSAPGWDEDLIPVRIVEQSPEWIDSHILNLYLVLINSSQKYVYITNPYFIPPKSLQRALCHAAQRGVDVRILTQEKTDEERVRRLSRYHFAELVECGVKVYGWERSILHAKGLVVDGEWCSVGSCNLDGRALFLNYEANYLLRNRRISAQLSQQFLKDIAVSRQYNLEECHQMLDPLRWLYCPLRGQF